MIGEGPRWPEVAPLLPSTREAESLRLGAREDGCLWVPGLLPVERIEPLRRLLEEELAARGWLVDGRSTPRLSLGAWSFGEPVRMGESVSGTIDRFSPRDVPAEVWVRIEPVVKESVTTVGFTDAALARKALSIVVQPFANDFRVSRVESIDECGGFA